MSSNIVMIAGAGPGMGMAVARRFAREGFDVALLARNEARLATCVRELEALGVRAVAVRADLTDAADTQRAVAAVQTQLGSVTVLVYNASRWRQVPTMELDPADFDQDIRLAATGALVCAQAVYPDMKARGQGTLLFTGGGLALAPQYGPQVASLAAGKAAMRNLTLVMREELEPEGLHVATVTVAGNIAPHTPFDPDTIAEHYWRIHTEPVGSWTVEHVFRGES